MRTLTIVLAVAFSLVASAARADEGLPNEPPTSRWYGWQTLIADGASLTTVVGGLAGQNAPITYLGMGGFVLATPSVHVAHGNPGRALGSLALRAGLPVLGFAVGYAAFHQSRSGDWLNLSGIGEGALLGLGGVAACVALDAALFATDTERKTIAASTHPRYQPTVSPRIGYIRGGAVAGLGGSF